MNQIIKGYQDQEDLRRSFNALAMKTFELSFENWHKNGYWSQKYIPYSIIRDNKVIANVSVNIMDMNWNGTTRHLIQLGTVMTEKAYRNQGLIRSIMEEIQADYSKQIDGMYLFANDSVLDFYPKFGFRAAVEYQYSKSITNTAPCSLEKVPMNHKKEWAVMEQVIQNMQFKSRLEMADNPGIYLFYLTQFMQDFVYYDRAENSYILAEIEGEEAIIHGIFSGDQENQKNQEKQENQGNQGNLEAMISHLGPMVHRVTLGFTPENTTTYSGSKREEEDSTLFVQGSIFDQFEKERLMFPLISHT